jgi:hypothetical protein
MVGSVQHLYWSQTTSLLGRLNSLDYYGFSPGLQGFRTSLSSRRALTTLGEVVVYKTTLSAGFDFICEEILYLTNEGRQCREKEATYIILVWDKAQ